MAICDCMLHFWKAARARIPSKSKDCERHTARQQQNDSCVSSWCRVLVVLNIFSELTALQGMYSFELPSQQGSACSTSREEFNLLTAASPGDECVVAPGKVRSDRALSQAAAPTLLPSLADRNVPHQQLAQHILATKSLHTSPQPPSRLTNVTAHLTSATLPKKHAHTASPRSY